MKLILLTTTLLLSIAVFAQQNFEGTIIYDAHTSKRVNRDSAELIATFGKNAILLQFRELKDGEPNRDPEKLLIRLDSGKAYTINQHSKSYRVRLLPLNTFPLSYSKEKTIAGHKAVSKVISEANSVFLPNYILANTEFVLYVSDDLNYSIPEKYKIIPELILVSNNKIVLGATLRFFNGRLSGDDMDSEDPDADQEKADETVTFEAREINPHPVSPDLLTLPVDFTLKRRASRDDFAVADSMRVADSVAVSMAMADTLAVASPDKPIEKKPVKSPSKPKSKTSSQNSPARKPD